MASFVFSFLGLATGIFGVAMPSVSAQQPDELVSARPADNLATSIRIKVPLPITEQVDNQLRTGIDQAVKQWDQRQSQVPGQVRNRPTIVLEFDTSNNLNGRGSHFESCLSIARYLQRPEMSQVRLIAYVPPPTGISGEGGRRVASKSQLSGHALLVALACEQLWLDSAAGLLGLGGDVTEPELERVTYEYIAKRGTQWPQAFVSALIDGRGGLYNVNRADGKSVWVDQQGRQALSEAGQEISSEEILQPGQEAQWSAAQLAGWGLTSQPIINRNDLIARLETDRLVDFNLGQQFDRWSVAMLRVERLDQEFLAWATRSLNADRISNQTNMLLLRIDTLGSYDLRAAGELALLVADLGQQGVRTVALLPNGAKGAETILALACDEIVIVAERRFGGNVTLPLADENATDDLLSVARSVAEKKNRDWSLVAALAFGNQQTFEYQNRKTGSLRILTEEQYGELVDRDDWQRGVEIKLASGLTSQEAKQRRIVDHLVEDVDRIEALYPVKSIRTLQPGVTDRTVQRFARFISSPGITHLLLMIGFFLLMTELSSPGLGVPGFLSACCLSLFFWANYFEGSAGALEIILFLLGIAFVVIEIFVLPGFGLFGIGGGLMIMASLVLAGQNFVVPQNSYEVNRMMWNMTSVLGAMAGIFAAMVFIRYYMESVPVLNRLILKPPTESTRELEVQSGRYGHLLHRHGVVLTPLMPAGKVRFGSEVISVVTDGQVVETGEEVRVYEVWDTLVKVEPVRASQNS